MQWFCMNLQLTVHRTSGLRHQSKYRVTDRKKGRPHCGPQRFFSQIITCKWFFFLCLYMCFLNVPLCRKTKSNCFHCQIKCWLIHLTWQDAQGIFSSRQVLSGVNTEEFSLVSPHWHLPLPCAMVRDHPRPRPSLTLAALPKVRLALSAVLGAHSSGYFEQKCTSYLFFKTSIMLLA